MSGLAELDPAWGSALAPCGLPDLAPLLDSAPDRLPLGGDLVALVKPGLASRERWRWRLPVGSPTETLFLKRYRTPSWRDQADRCLRRTLWHSSSAWEHSVTRQLALGHVAAAHSIGFAERMSGCVERASVVALIGLPGAPLDAACREWLAQGIRPRVRRDLARRLGLYVAAFHGAGYCHRDLYLCHVFVHPVHPAAQAAFSLIDLARAMRPWLRRMRWLIKDLAQLDVSARQVGVSRTDRLRVLLAYLGLTPGSPRVRAYVRRILRRSDSMLRRMRRSEP